METAYLGGQPLSAAKGLANQRYLDTAQAEATEVEMILNCLGALIERSGMTCENVGNITAKLVGEPGNAQAGGTAPKPVRGGSLGKIRDMLDMIECNMGRTDEHVQRLRNAI